MRCNDEAADDGWSTEEAEPARHVDWSTMSKQSGTEAAEEGDRYTMNNHSEAAAVTAAAVMAAAAAAAAAAPVGWRKFSGRIVDSLSHNSDRDRAEAAATAATAAAAAAVDGQYTTSTQSGMLIVYRGASETDTKQLQ